MTTIRFSSADQRRFAALSGDRNPVHLDPVAARRVAAGEPIVHGMHLLLRMLDRHLRRAPASDLRIEARFLRPVLVDEPVAIYADSSGELVAEAPGDLRLAHASIRPADRDPSPRTNAHQADKPRAIAARPRVRSLADVESAHGALVPTRSPACARAFPFAVRSLGGDVVAALASLSALVGMECPGRDSLLSAVCLRITPRARVRLLSWRVSHVDRRFGRARLDVAGEGFTGTVDAFVLPQAVPPPPLAAIAERVRTREFDGQRALVVGGSRGLGAVTAMVVAAGGGLPVLTYASGAADAALVRRTLCEAGHRAETLRLDVMAPDAAAIVARAVKRFNITHLYYFATPRIFVRRSVRPFDAVLFERFAEMYVQAFVRVCTAALRDGCRLDVFYPSSDAVANTPSLLAEYAAAKAAGESIVPALERAGEQLAVFVSRLPRVATDQTASIFPMPAASPIDVVLPIVREMQRRFVERTR